MIVTSYSNDLVIDFTEIKYFFTDCIARIEGYGSDGKKYFAYGIVKDGIIVEHYTDEHFGYDKVYTPGDDIEDE